MKTLFQTAFLIILIFVIYHSLIVPHPKIAKIRDTLKNVINALKTFNKPKS